MVTIFKYKMPNGLFEAMYEVMGPGQKIDPSRVGSIFCGSGRVSHLWFGFEFEKFPIKMSNFSIL